MTFCIIQTLHDNLSCCLCCDTTEILGSDVFNEMNEKQGEIVGAIVRRKEGNNVYVEISGTQMEGVMMQVDQVPTETYNLNDMIKVYVKKIRETLKGAQVIVSRSAVAFRLSASEKTFPIVAFIAILNKLSNICAKKGLKYVTFV